ncbi:MAG TPA: hypothetical protein VLG49_02480 [Rhabdochlamydiaceae bacterium]|nr:hypothetical protein [Rhabdochlamydiaceae bacterium]
MTIRNILNLSNNLAEHPLEQNTHSKIPSSVEVAETYLTPVSEDEIDRLFSSLTSQNEAKDLLFGDSQLGGNALELPKNPSLAQKSIKDALNTVFRGNVPKSLDLLTEDSPHLKRKTPEHNLEQNNHFKSFRAEDSDVTLNKDDRDEMDERFLKGLFNTDDDANFVIPESNLNVYKTNALTGSQKLELPIRALEELSRSLMTKKQILSYFPENNKLQDINNKSTFVFDDSENFPDYYLPPPSHYKNHNSYTVNIPKANDRLCSRQASIYMIGIMLLKIKEVSNLKIEELDSLIKEMTDSVKDKKIDSRLALHSAFSQLVQIHASLLEKQDDKSSIGIKSNYEPLYLEKQNQAMVNLNDLLFREYPNLRNILDKTSSEPQGQSFLAACSGLKLSEKLEYGIAALKIITLINPDNGLSGNELHNIILENAFFERKNGKLIVHFNTENQDVPVDYIRPYTLLNSEEKYYNIPFNIFTVGQGLKIAIQKSNDTSLELDSEVDDLINSMLDDEPRRRPTLIRALRDLKTIQADLVAKGK